MLNAATGITTIPLKRPFQSLIGIKWNLNREGVVIERSSKVSIPDRD